ncbi:putative aldouronate transport system permease protein [Paenibacillus aceris]|uniref:Aldouronate transport system permease protein n=2 Tax=Paenibacillus aceris TaxID=869555 RepID=A0ABS4I0N6_9BACL|nr:ABC transporter permease subunit [Paenibacillus aceris]MBP1964280.1 putative aldouronate transport system permease protein [Paenibacillus aceris]
MKEGLSMESVEASIERDVPQRIPSHKRAVFLKRLNRSKYLLILFLPCFIYYVLFKYLPMFGLVISFKDYNLFKGVWASDWVGLKYYKMFFESPDFLKLFRNTFLLGVSTVLFGFPVPIILALCLNEVKNLFFKRFVQTVSYVPHFISNVIVIGMVVMFLSPTTGIVAHFVKLLGLQPVNLLVQPGWFRPIYVLADIWQHAGWGSIIYLAALTAIDPQLYEAAAIDGASRWKQLWNVTIPGIMPAMVIMLILNIGHIIDIGFEKVFLLMNPATYDTGDIFSTFVYRMGLTLGNYSYGTAVDLFTGIISLIFIYTANYIGRKVSETSLW